MAITRELVSVAKMAPAIVKIESKIRGHVKPTKLGIAGQASLAIRAPKMARVATENITVI